ncbi:Transposase [Enhygromyxa salina]|uniref:Transposase n=1 Tax=Enhygromyxa salina TaxID=215803 RepID=A0A0C2D685_9BACT|nr:Rpn family recombination-promoting nuclease/putative transposase [Enhygromyxa salina]KIG17165.1 Transposase [Enhygromyxa salina]
MTATPHDALFKAAFEHPEHAAGFLRSILPAPICAAIDWSTIAHEPGSFVAPRLSGHHTDLLFRARLIGHAEHIYFYLLLEHQSTLDPDMPRRMLGYVMHKWERERKRRSAPLPIVLPILICHVPGGWTAPTSMQALFEPPPNAIPGLAKFVPHLTMHVEDLSSRSNVELRSFSLAAFPMLALWLLRDARTPGALFDNFGHWADAFAATLQAPSGAESYLQLLSYVFWVCNREHYDRFRENIQAQLPQAKDTVMKIAEMLIEQGRNEGRNELLEKLLALKFGPLPPTYKARLASATLEQLDLYATRVLTADSLEAVFAG